MATKKPRTISLKKALKKTPASRRSRVLPKKKIGAKILAKKPTSFHAQKSVKTALQKPALSASTKRKLVVKNTLKKSSTSTPSQKRKKRVIPPKLLSPQNALARKTKALVKPFIDSEKLPEQYANSSITLMPRDPHWIYAYWDVSEFAMKQAKDRIGPLFKKSKFTIRVHDASGISSSLKKAPLSFDIDVNPKAQSWYVNSSRDNMTYYADFGVRTPKGDFYPLARSNTVSTPRASEGEQGRVWWKKVVGNGDALALVNAQGPKPRTLENTIGHMPVRTPQKELSLATPDARLTEKDVRDYYTAHFEALEKISVLSPVKNDLSQDNSDATKNNLSIFKNVLIGAQSEGHGLGLTPDGQKAVIMGAPNLGGASDLLQNQKSFVFELGTELIVYGKTEPFAEVWMGANKIEVREDGSFSLRLALPEGSVPLDFTARSPDATSVKTIVTAVHRAPLTYL
jgi:hypothetical protein